MVAKLLMKIVGIAGLALGGGGLVYNFGRHRASETTTAVPLSGGDFGHMRFEALDLFPRGSPISAAAAGLSALGFKCAPARHMLANINAPSVECDSAGRGYPVASRTQITVMARNGMVSDIAVGNGYDPFHADARTPHPDQGSRAAIAGS